MVVVRLRFPGYSDREIKKTSWMAADFWFADAVATFPAAYRLPPATIQLKRQ
jgi:hypothetical protein